MSKRRKTSPARRHSLMMKSVELALAVPQVMGHRLWRMALAGPLPSAVDRAEFQLMGLEKLAAFAESWQAMSWQMWQIQQDLVLGMMRLWLPWWPGRNVFSQHWLRQAGAGVLSAGLAPVHRRATANARRLSRRAAGTLSRT
jgi:hypothetical protein